MSKSEIKVVHGLEPTYKRQRTEFTEPQLRSVPIGLLSWEQYQLLDETISNPRVTYETLASGYGWPVGTVKSRLSRARAKLNKYLEEA